MAAVAFSLVVLGALLLFAGITGQSLVQAVRGVLTNQKPAKP